MEMAAGALSSKQDPRSPRTFSREQPLLDIDYIADSLAIICRFRQRLINASVELALKQRPEFRSMKRIRVVTKRAEMFTSWFYDQVACGALELDGLRFQVNECHTEYLEQFIAPGTLQTLLQILREPTGALDVSQSRFLRLFNDMASPAEGNSGILSDFYKKDFLQGPENLVFRRRGSRLEMIHPKLHLYSTVELYNLCNAAYRGLERMRLPYLFALLGLYSSLVVDNNYLSVPPGVTRKCDFELFGSPFNTRLPYFSPFPSLERFFGSRGSFFTAPLPEEFTVFSYNPPFSEFIMQRAATRLLQELQRRAAEKKPATVLATLPVWDSTSQRQIGAPDFHRDFLGYELLVESPFCRENYIWKEQVKFYDYLKNAMVPTVNIHLLILSTEEKPHLTLEEVRRSWHR